MRRAAPSLLLAGALLGCAGMPTLTERPEEYHLYRQARVAPTLEERLRAAHRYLREVPQGRRQEQLRTWFDDAEEKYYLEAFNSLPRLYAYVDALPRGPHIAEVRARIAALEARRHRRSEHELREDAKIAATQERLAQADAGRRHFVATFKDWTARLIRLRSFGEPTSELDHETIFAFRLSDPRGVCRGDVCRKTLQLSYEVPGERELLTRAAVLEVALSLDRGRLQSARLVGPELWTRLAEALSLEPLPAAGAERRAEALRRSTLLVRAVLEPALPGSECELPSAPPVVLARACRGVRARMLAGDGPADDDGIEVEPWTAASEPGESVPAAAGAVAPQPAAPVPVKP